jgi:hypothetical protein
MQAIDEGIGVFIEDASAIFLYSGIGRTDGMHYNADPVARNSEPIGVAGGEEDTERRLTSVWVSWGCIHGLERLWQSSAANWRNRGCHHFRTFNSDICVPSNQEG